MVPVTQDKSPATLHLFEQRSWNSYLFKPVELELTKNKWPILKLHNLIILERYIPCGTIPTVKVMGIYPPKCLVPVSNPSSAPTLTPHPSRQPLICF